MRHRVCLFFALILGGGVSVPAWAWNALGHRVVAHIAYAHLTPPARRRVDALTAYLDTSAASPREPHQQASKPRKQPASRAVFWRSAGYRRFLWGAVWPDRLRAHDVHAFDHWHYRDQPISAPDRDGSGSQSSDDTDLLRTVLTPNQNIVWALVQAEAVLASPRATAREKAVFLRFFTHLVGDVHQPLHCASWVNTHYPHGDKGGTLFPVKSRWARRLHAFWDRGGGLLIWPRPSRHGMKTSGHASSPQQVVKLAKRIEAQYPWSQWLTQKADPQQTPRDWATQSHDLARDVAYHFFSYAHVRMQSPQGYPLSLRYQQRTQAVVMRQLAFAGYRLAYWLNHQLRSHAANEQRKVPRG